MVLTETWLKGRQSVTSLELTPEQRQKMKLLGYASAGTEEVETPHTVTGGGGLFIVPTGKGAGEGEKVEVPPKTEEKAAKTETPEEKAAKEEAEKTQPTTEAGGFDFAKFISNNWLWLLLLLLLIAIIIMSEE